MKDNEKTIMIIDDAISAVRKEIDRNNFDKDGAISQDTLSSVLEILILMRKKINGEEQIVENDFFGFGLGRLIVDSWPVNNTIGDLVIHAEQTFKKRIRDVYNYRKLKT